MPGSRRAWVSAPVCCCFHQSSSTPRLPPSVLSLAQSTCSDRSNPTFRRSSAMRPLRSAVQNLIANAVSMAVRTAGSACAPSALPAGGDRGPHHRRRPWTEGSQGKTSLTSSGRSTAARAPCPGRCMATVWAWHSFSRLPPRMAKRFGVHAPGQGQFVHYCPAVDQPQRPASAGRNLTANCRRGSSVLIACERPSPASRRRRAGSRHDADRSPDG